jgi:hypothetical protein
LNPSSLEALGFSIRLSVFSRDETPGVNLIHSGNLGLGFARGVSSYLTPNDFKFECEFLVSGDERCQAKGDLQKIEGLLPTGARDESKKGAAICGVTS